MNHKITDWDSCYNLGWKGIITDIAFTHPAKFSHGLIKRIYAHLLAEGMVKPGDVILDPFGGVSLGGLYALQNGLHWVGVELEEKFCALGQANIDLWNSRYAAHFPRWGSAVLLQGDSRRLAEIVAGAGCVVGSPPFTDNGANDKRFGGGLKDKAIIANSKNGGGGLTDYGQTPGQLAALPPGSIEAVVSSSPFAGSVGSDDPAKRGGLLVSDPKRAGDVNLMGSYGTTPGQLGRMAVVGSPPFEDCEPYQDKSFRPNDGRKALPQGQDGYGNSAGQLGQESSETFWTAARTILEQCYQILPDNAPAVWVTKRYVKGGKIVDFPGQWQALCEACGFETVEVIRAWLVKRNGAQAGLDGEMVENKIERKSFFRRLSETRTRAKKHWKTLGRYDRARLLWASHNELWEDYRRRLDLPDEKKASPVTRTRILGGAQTMGWVRDGRIDYEIETAIDYETVLVTRKRGDL